MNYGKDNVRQMPLSNQNAGKNSGKAKSGAPVRKRRRKVWDRLFTLGIGLDMQLLLLVLFLLGIGLATLFSASYTYSYYYNDGDSFYYIKRQLVFAVLGVASMLFFSIVNYRYFKRLAWPIYLFCIGLLAIVLLLRGSSLVPQINGAYRWINLGFISFQPSEFAKFGIVVVLAHILSKRTDEKHYRKSVTIPVLVSLVLMVLLIVLENHISATLIVFGISAVILIVGGFNWKWLAGMAGLGAAGVTSLVLFTDNFAYALVRIQGWLNPFNPPEVEGKTVDTYQTIQSLYAIGSGGLIGQGIGNSRQKQLFLPEPQNDFIFSIFCEEMGFCGAFLVVCMFIWLVYRGMKISLASRDRFGTLLGLGITFTIGIEAALNICVVTSVIPNTGISLPFFSYGGTSLVILLTEMGVLLSISRNNFNDASVIANTDIPEAKEDNDF